MDGAHFTYIWQYSIRPERREVFLAAYRSNGDWANLFSRDSNYIGTELLQNSSDRNEYLTIDYWTSKSARDSFRELFSVEFEALDRRCEEYTVNEVFVGDFVIHKPVAT